MDSDKLMRGIIPGIIAGYLFLAFIGASVVPGASVSQRTTLAW